MKEVDQYAAKLEEYRGLRGLPDGAIEHALVGEHAWTREAAGLLLLLAREYGAFVLRSALALAVVLELEDGDAGL